MAEGVDVKVATTSRRSSMKRLCFSILSNSCGFLLGWLGILKCFHSFSASSSTFREPMTSLILSQLFWGIARSIKVFAHDGCLRSHLPTVFTASFSLLSSQFSTDSCSAAGTAFDAIRTCTHACAAPPCQLCLHALC